MIKKLSFFLLIGIFLTSCSVNTSYQSIHAKKYGYFTFPNTDWGMTQEDFLTAFGMELSDFTVDEMQEDLHALVREIEFADEACITRFEFALRCPHGVQDSALTAIRIFYPAKGSDDFEKLCDEVDRIIASQEVDITASAKIIEKELADGTVVHPVQPEFDKAKAVKESYCYTIESNSTNVDLPQDVKDAYDRLLQDKLGKTPDDEWAKRITGIDNMPQTLSSVSVSYQEDTSDSTNSCIVTFSGRGMEEVYGFIRAYEPETYKELFG